MAKLDNSKRRLPQAVYAKVDLRSKGKVQPSRSWVKLGLVAAAKLTADETTELRLRLDQERRHKDAVDQEAVDSEIQALAVIEAACADRGTPELAEVLPRLSGVEASTLASLGVVPTHVVDR